jgi:hypothetical protein
VLQVLPYERLLGKFLKKNVPAVIRLVLKYFEDFQSDLDFFPIGVCVFPMVNISEAAIFHRTIAYQYDSVDGKFLGKYFQKIS